MCFTTANVGERSKNRPDLDSSLNEESFLRSAPLISARTGKPGSVLKERESSQELEDEMLMSALQVQREQILAEAKLEMQTYEEKASFDEKYIRNLRNQIDSRDWDLRRTVEVHMEASQTKDRLQQEVADKERALHEDRLRGFHEIGVIYLSMNSRKKLQENQNTINNLMNRVRELQFEIDDMHDSKDFKDAESVHSGQLSHVPSESALFLLQDERGDLLGSAEIMPPKSWNAQCTSGDVFTSPPACPRHPIQGYPHYGTIQIQEEFQREPVRCSLYLKTVMEEKGAIPNPRFLRSSSTGNSFDPTKGEILRIMVLTNNDFKSRNLILTSSLFHKRFRVGR